ncbi:MAG: hypothetical protein ACHQ49_04430 [Elusimicrobiota bacterium]
MAPDDEAPRDPEISPFAPGAAPVAMLRSILGRPGQELPLDLADPRFQELVEIVNLAVQVHGDRTQEWFSHPEPELGFVLPATLMRDPANGRKLVKQSLMNHLRGVYALGQDDRVLPQSRPILAAVTGPALPRSRKVRLPKPRKKPRA